LAIADQSRTEDYKNYWNNVFLPADMRAACSKKGASFDDSRNECNITITLKQIAKEAKDAKGVKLGNNVGCRNEASITKKVGAGSLPCSLIAFGITRGDCLDADQQAIDDNKKQKTTAVVTGLVTGLGGVATGVLTGFTIGNETCEGEGLHATCTKKGFNKGIGISTAVGGALTGVTTGLTMGLTAANTTIAGTGPAPVNCYSANGELLASDGGEIDLRW
jgi:hypothetical protein